MARICIITPGAIGSNPRVVKEADALSEAGHDVTVVSTRTLDFVDLRDDDVIAGALWSSHRVDLRRSADRRPFRLVQIAARLVHAATGHAATQAYSVFTTALARHVRAQRADLYIAHYVAALPLAAMAAKRHGARYAFDAEDFHAGDLPDTAENARENRLIGQIEARWLPGASYVTAAAPGIADAYAATYGIPRPTVVLNTFPKDAAPPTPTAKGSATPGPTLYWFSQTIGLHRGLECALRAIARSKTRPHLYLRGSESAGFADELRRIAAGEGVANHLHFLAPEAPSRMEALAAEYDAGLVGETGWTPNRDIALTNKQFTYFIAGVPALMSDTSGHRAFVADAPGAAFLFKADNTDDLARAIDELLGDPKHLSEARKEAFRLGQERFNWGIEKTRLISRVEQALAGASK